MAVGDVYQIVDKQELFGQEVLNVYFYAMGSGSVTDGDGATGVAMGFIDNVLPSIYALQVSQLVHTSIKATNLFDATDAHEILISLPGTTDVDYNTTFDAFGFRIVGDNASVRSGAKRIAGVSDSRVTDGVVTDAGLLALLASAATTIASGIAFGVDTLGSLAPVIVKRLLVGTEYKLPTTLGDAVLSFVTDVLVDAMITSQVSRKVGRGA